MKPDVFVPSVVNGSHKSPFFMTRFKEALHHFSALFDMMDVNMPWDSPERMFIEEEYYGRGAINVISCEGTERFERPETYKQWQNRVAKAGFRQVPLDRGLLEIYQARLKEHCNGDLMVYEDNKWLLQGYQGRIIYASSGWTSV
ncbi:hypothetical protein CDL15_Pgr024983 [Punica granatum]|nr:hypothetical protein CDL15_Pgr024983 [Punica granatum]